MGSPDADDATETHTATPFADRAAAGRAVAARVRARLDAFTAGRDDVVAVGLARGGVPVAAEVARALGVALDVLVVRKLGVPAQPELALGAIASGGVRVLNADVVARAGASPRLIEEVTRVETEQLRRREDAYRRGAPPVPLAGRTVILVDDGLATGASMRVAVEAVRRAAPARIVVAVPVAPVQVCRAFEGLADDVVCVRTPQDFAAVGQFYNDFRPTSDDEVAALIARLARRR